jgi:hypothetical protein
MGVWQVPGGAAAPKILVTGMTPARTNGPSPAHYTFSFADTQSVQDLGVMNILVNDFLDGRHACYLAYSRPSNTLYLENDNGDALLAGQPLADGGSIGNSQCSVTWGPDATTIGGNTLTLTLNIAFSSAFAGNRVFYLAARDVNEGNNTDWQSMGVWSVQKDRASR